MLGLFERHPLIEFFTLSIFIKCRAIVGGSRFSSPTISHLDFLGLASTVGIPPSDYRIFYDISPQALRWRFELFPMQYDRAWICKPHGTTDSIRNYRRFVDIQSMRNPHSATRAEPSSALPVQRQERFGHEQLGWALSFLEVSTGFPLSMTETGSEDNGLGGLQVWGYRCNRAVTFKRH